MHQPEPKPPSRPVLLLAAASLLLTRERPATQLNAAPPGGVR